jgi:hypothetical protein
MEGEEKKDPRGDAIHAAREAESMTAGVRIINKFNIENSRAQSEQTGPDIHFQEIWPYLTEARWKELRQLTFREDLFRSRAALIERCKSEPLLDAALELVNHNGIFRYSSGDELYIDPSELFQGVPPSEIQDALSRARRMLGDANNVVMALFNYPQATRTYEEELERFKRDNPGFSEKSYELAEQRNMIGM